MPKDINEYRVVCPENYPKGTDFSAMSGYYPRAKTLGEAFSQVRETVSFLSCPRGVLWKSWDSEGNPVPVPKLPDYWL